MPVFFCPLGASLVISALPIVASYSSASCLFAELWGGFGYALFVMVHGHVPSMYLCVCTQRRAPTPLDYRKLLVVAFKFARYVVALGRRVQMGCLDIFSRGPFPGATFSPVGYLLGHCLLVLDVQKAPFSGSDAFLSLLLRCAGTRVITEELVGYPPWGGRCRDCMHWGVRLCGEGWYGVSSLLSCACDEKKKVGIIVK